MSGQHHDDTTEIERRSFMKGVGATAGAAALGVGATGGAAGAEEIEERLLNWRSIEARKVWDRGFRGRPDRTLALTDSGISVRHPDVGPFNDVTAIIQDGEFRLIDAEESTRETVALGSKLEEFRTGTAGVGTFVEGSEVATEPFVPQDVVDEQFSTSGTPVELDAWLFWEPYEDNTNDLELRLDVKVDGDWEPVATAASPDMPEKLSGIAIEAGKTYRFVAEQYKNVAADFWIDLQFYEYDGELVDGDDPFAFLDEEYDDEPMPKTVGWYDAGGRYGSWRKPRDPNGHGSHVSGIMAGTGRACTIDYDNTRVEKPHAILLPGDFVEYEIDVPATSSAFVSLLGENVKIELLFDGEIVHETRIEGDSTIADEPAVHDSGTATYTVRVRPWETDAAAPAAERAQEGNPTAGRLKQIALGSYVPPAEVTEGARTPGGPQTVHPGLAPDMSLVGLQGLASPTADLGAYADEFAGTFNIRAVNMSWGYAYGLPFGAFGGALSDLPSALKNMAQAGILPVAAAGNFMTPANGMSVPAGVDESVSVAATGPLDGLTPYSAGGIASVDEDEDDYDRKPDVTAPGGQIPDYAVLLATAVAGVPYPVPEKFELVRSVLAADPDESFAAGDPPRDYDNAGGTSMASPYTCGVAGLVAQAMEEEAPDPIQLPTPKELAAMDEESAFAWTMRYKQVLLATANETAFTAAPYHAAKSPPSAPVYTHGGRDPYEGFGRVNPDAAVDAVSRNLLDGEPQLGEETYETTASEAVGTYVPEDSRAVAGYVHVPGGDLEVSLDFSDYSGANRGMAAGAPHLDLFVYDAEAPAENGAPNVVASDRGEQGTASVSVGVDRGSRDDPNERTFYVVAKIVNIPGVVNGFDVQANFDLDVSFAPAPEFTTEFTASGRRSDDGDAFTGGQTNTVEVTLESFQHADEVTVSDTVPEGWTVDEEYGDVERFDPDSRTVHFEGTVTESAVAGDGEVTFTYFAEAPSGAGNSDEGTFGPAAAEVVTPDVPEGDGDGELDGDGVDTFGGTDRAVVVGASTEA